MCVSRHNKIEEPRYQTTRQSVALLHSLLVEKQLAQRIRIIML